MKHYLFVQNGNYADAYKSFSQGGAETYRDQKRSVGFVADLAKTARVSTLAFGDSSSDEELAPNLFAYCRKRADLGTDAIATFLDAQEPSHLILRTPHRQILQQASRRNIAVLPVFADLFVKGGVRGTYNHLRLRRALLACKPPCVSNHSLNASRSLVSTLRLKPAQVVPWDWSRVPVHDTPKQQMTDPAAPRLFFAGVLSESKGVGDCLEAVAQLRKSGVDWQITFAGKGDQDKWRARADALSISEAVTFLGMIPNTEVRTQMRAHDFVIVPSRHSYPEGLPNTIYEALASRSVLVISDHPSFAGRLTPQTDCLLFEAADPTALARCLQEAYETPALYAQMSQNAEAAHDRLYVGMEWTALVRQFLDDPSNDSGWVQTHALSTYKHT